MLHVLYWKRDPVVIQQIVPASSTSEFVHHFAGKKMLIEVHAERDPRCSLVVVNTRFHKEIYSDCG